MHAAARASGWADRSDRRAVLADGRCSSPPSAGRNGRRREARPAVPAAASGLRPADLAVGVGGELLLVAFELRPIDVALVVILEQNLPLLERLAVAVALARAPSTISVRFSLLP